MGEVDLSDLHRVIMFDPASGKQVLKKIRARAAIVAVGMDAHERFFVLDAWMGRESVEKMILRLFAMNTRWRPHRVGIESNAMQSTFADAIMYIAKEKQVRIPIWHVEQSTKVDKNFRIRNALQPIISSGRLFFQDNMDELEAEIRAFPTGIMKDGIDALAAAISKLCPQVAAEWQEAEEENYQSTHHVYDNYTDYIDDHVNEPDHIGPFYSDGSSVGYRSAR